MASRAGREAQAGRLRALSSALRSLSASPISAAASSPRRRAIALLWARSLPAWASLHGVEGGEGSPGREAACPEQRAPLFERLANLGRCLLSEAARDRAKGTSSFAERHLFSRAFAALRFLFSLE